MATIVTRIGKGSQLTTAEMDANLNNLNDFKVELDDLSVSTGSASGAGELTYDNLTGVFEFKPADLGTYVELNDLSVTTAAPDGGGSLSYNNITGVFTFTPGDLSLVMGEVVDDTAPTLGGNLDVDTFSITTGVTNGSIGIAPNGTGALNVTSGTGINITANAGEAKIFTTTTNANIRLAPEGTGVVKVDKDIDLEAKALITSTTNGNLKLSANGTGSISIEGGAGIDLKDSASITTSSAATDIDITATGYINLNSNTLFGAGFEETISLSATTTGTYAPSISDGTIHYVAMTGSMTINGFTDPVAGQTISLLFDGTGGSYTLTLGLDMLTPGGSLALTDGGIDVVTITCVDDLTPTYIATAVNNFQ